MSFTNILVPYDGSKPSIRSFKVALDMAKKHGSKLKVVTFIGEADVGAWYIDVKLNKEIMKKAKNFSKKYLSRLEDIAKKEGVHVSSDVIQTDSIVKELLSFTKSKKIDLIVMGASGRGRFDKLMLGSIANGVSQRAKCPVLIIKL